MTAFIIGPPRSGTTLLSYMLDGHSDLAVMVESHLFGVYRAVADRLGDRFGELWPELLPRMLDSRPLVYIEPRIDPKSLLHRRFGDYADLARAILETWTEQRGKRIWIEKTPAHTLCWRYLADRFPKARFVAIVRDPRASTASLIRARFGPSAASTATRRWVRYCEAIDAFRRAEPHRLHLLRYEELVHEPRETLAGICDFLGIGLEEAMLTPQPSSRVMTDAVNRQRLQGRVIAGDTERWRRSMPEHQQRICSSIARVPARRLGFEIEAAAVGVEDRLKDWLDLARLVVKRSRNLQGQAEWLDQARLRRWARLRPLVKPGSALTAESMAIALSCWP